jgi:hypothetical protein
MSLGSFMYENGANHFFGFGNTGIPSLDSYSNDLNIYTKYSGFTLGGGTQFKVPVSTLKSLIRQSPWPGTDTFGCDQQQYTFGTIEVKNSDVNSNTSYFYSVWIPTDSIQISWSNMTVAISRDECSQIISDTIPLPSLSTQIVTVGSGASIPAGTYRVLWMPYSGYITPELAINYPLYFKGEILFI